MPVMVAAVSMLASGSFVNQSGSSWSSQPQVKAYVPYTTVDLLLVVPSCGERLGTVGKVSDSRYQSLPRETRHCTG